MSETRQPARGDTAGDPEQAAEFPRSSEHRRSSNNLPLQLTSFVGREQELEEITDLVAANRLLTLTGSGGSGKTRLVLTVAAGLAEDFEEGVWLVELASLSDAGLVPQAIASVLGVRENPGSSLVEALSAYLQPRTALLILDNCEHLIRACADVAAALLGSCPNLRILATSREALGVPGEMLYTVPPLTLPDPRRPLAVDGLPHYEATRLFVERATAVRRDFALTERNAMAVAQICYRLDGMPLAIELAAARARVLSVEQISSRLDDSFRLLTSGGRAVLGRQRTLRATMDWSYELLSAEERALLRRLSVFAGGFTLEAAEAVGAGEGVEEDEILDMLASLVDKSLVMVREVDGSASYRLLETVRQYGRQRLEKAGEDGTTLRRHAEYYLALAEEGSTEPGEQGARLRNLEAEQGNFRAALGWALGPGPAESEDVAQERAVVGLRLAVALGQGRFWAANGLSEGLRWLEEGLTRSGNSLPDPVRATALNEAGWIATVQGNGVRAVVLLEESFVLSRRLGDKSGVAASLVQLGQLLTMSDGDPERVAALREEAETLRSETLEPSQAAYLVMFMALASWHGHDDEVALALFEEGLGQFRDLGNLQGAAVCLGSIGFLKLEREGPVQAATIFEEALRILMNLRDRVGIYHCLLGAASVALLRGDPVHAARLWGAAEALGEASAVGLVPLIRAHYDYEGHLHTARSRLGDGAFKAAWTEGRAMSSEQAIEHALGTLPTPETAPPPKYPAGLSGREVEVLGLVAKGLTNAQIAQRLYISPRTVNAHLGSVYHKIGTSTRAEATRFAVEYGLL